MFETINVKYFLCIKKYIEQVCTLVRKIMIRNCRKKVHFMYCLGLEQTMVELPIYLYLCLSLYLRISIYISICVSTYLYIYIYYSYMLEYI